MMSSSLRTKALSLNPEESTTFLPFAEFIAMLAMEFSRGLALQAARTESRQDLAMSSISLRMSWL